MLGQDRPEKKLSQMLIRSDEIPSPRQTLIDKTNDCAMKSYRSALVRGCDLPFTVFTKRPVIRGGRRPGV